MSKEKNTGEDIYINGKLAIAILVTFSLLIITLIGMFICIAIDANGDSGYAQIDDGPSKQVANNDPNSLTPSAKSEAGKKTGIVLPCATKSGSYLGAINDRTQDISGDTAISSAAAALINVTDGKAVALKSANVKIYPASMTKVMTLLVACENAKDPNALLTVTDEMVKKYNASYNASKEDGPSVAISWKSGYQVTMEDALHMIIYESDTYACWLVANSVAGSEEGFVALMNAKAKSLNIDTTTHFENVTGLYHDNHYTTCLDMAAIMAAAMNNEAARSVLTNKEKYTVDIYVDGKATETASMYTAWYTSRLEAYRYPNTAPKYAGNGSDIELIGGKTGYETIPTNCYVTAGKNDVTGTLYVCVQVGRIDDKTQTAISAQTSTNDNRVIYQKYALD
ncbi:MAG: D-alanyl-D-alanine carboxypeptidase [Clostridia bacterium]|nr:D-alanyl-D-alanine carboxypeptidase [Clostridia bacterium]